MKVFLLEGSRGEYDEYISWAEGIFSTEEKLRDYERKFLENLEASKQLPCPIPEETYSISNWYDIVSDVEYDLVCNWSNITRNAKSFNKFNVLEYEVDEDFDSNKYNQL